MSYLHKRIKAHEGMSVEQKKSCNCDMCKGLNVGRINKKIKISKHSIKNPNIQ